MQYDPALWYWDVNGIGARLETADDVFPQRTRVYGTQAGGYVDAIDETYLAWVQTGIDENGFDQTTRIDTEASLTDVLAVYSITPNYG